VYDLKEENHFLRAVLKIWLLAKFREIACCVIMQLSTSDAALHLILATNSLLCFLIIHNVQVVQNGWLHKNMKLTFHSFEREKSEAYNNYITSDNTYEMPQFE